MIYNYNSLVVVIPQEFKLHVELSHLATALLHIVSLRRMRAPVKPRVIYELWIRHDLTISWCQNTTEEICAIYIGCFEYITTAAIIHILRGNPLLTSRETIQYVTWSDQLRADVCLLSDASHKGQCHQTAAHKNKVDVMIES